MPGDVYKRQVGIRPEVFILTENGPFAASLSRVEVMGRDVSVISSHPCSENPSVRSIITAETPADQDAGSCLLYTSFSNQRNSLLERSGCA